MDRLAIVLIAPEVGGRTLEWKTLVQVQRRFRSIALAQNGAGLAAVSSTDAWAVGAGIAHWDGTRWRVDSPPKFGGHTVNFESVSAASAGDVWAIGYAGSGTVVERWNGRKWMAAPGANGLAGSYGQPAVAATRAGSGAFAVGLNAIEWWTGSRWRSILSAVPGVYGGYFNSVAAVAGQFWMAGLYHRSANGKSTYGLIERWHDGSGIVTPIPSPNNHADLFGIAGTSARDVWAVGNRLRASDAQYHSALIIHWNGTSWRSVAPAVGAGPQVTLQAVAAISPVDAWAVGGGNPYSSPPVFEHWNGKAWTVVPGAGSLAAGSISGLSAVSHNDVWAVGAEESGAAQLPSPVIEHWNGTAWSVVPAHDTQNVDGGGLSAVTAVNAHDVWAVGGNQEGTDGINLVEHWNGGAWSIPAGPNTGGYSLVSVAAQSRRDIWAIGQEYAPYEPYIQHWNGSAWTDISSPFIGGQNILTSVAAASKSNAWAVGGEAFANTRQPVPIEHWNGRTWSVVVGPLPSW